MSAKRDNNVIAQYKQTWSNLFQVGKQNHVHAGEFHIRSIPAHVPLIALILKSDWLHRYQLCIDIIAIDQPGKRYRFSVVYHLLSLTYNTRYILTTQTTALQGLESLFMLYNSVIWSEREVWDLYGILIKNHPDLRRILTDYGFKDFPLRKDFPLSGHLELVYSATDHGIRQRPVELAQEYRLFHFTEKEIQR